MGIAESISVLTPVLRALVVSPEDISKKHIAVFERFVIVLYDRRSSLLNGDSSLKALSCFLIGQLSNKLKIAFMNLSTTGVKRCVEHVVNVLKQISYVSVGVTVTRTATYKQITLTILNRRNRSVSNRLLSKRVNT